MKPRLLMLVPTATYRAEAFVRAAQHLAIDLSIASEVPSSLSHLHPVDLPAFDFADARRVVEAARELSRSTRIDGVVAVDDQSVLAAALVADTLGLRHHPPDAVRAALNKYFGRERMHAAGIDVPRYRLIGFDASPAQVAKELARDVGYPLVLKPLAMAASRGVVRIDRPVDFPAAFTRLVTLVTSSPSPHDEIANRHVLAETYIPGHEVAVEGIVTRGDLHVFTVFDKVDPLEGPYFPETMYITPSRHPDAVQERIHDITRRTVSAVGLTDGPVHVELRVDGERVVPIEAHARSIGGFCSRVLRFDGGRSLEDLIILQSLGLLGEIPAREACAAGVWMMQAPRAGVFAGMGGISAATAVRDVEEVIVSARPAQVLTPLPDGFLYLGFIFSRAGSAQDVEIALRAAFSRLEPRFENAA
ncbi:MAG TPA: ATP-grasp domain-containing protein [Candidatus Krumholzibacteria bacterium]|nr:ATP-grasp domain-containing protein [Candidatus Krumholzibacteria bacterium]